MKFLPCTLNGAPLELHAFDGKHFRLVSSEAKAPGLPLTVDVALAPSITLELKSLGSVLRSDGRFDVRARAQTLSREARSALLAFFTP